MTMSSSSPIPNEELAEEIDAINAIYDPSTITTTSSPSSASTSNPSDKNENLPIQTAVILRLPDHEHLSSFLLGFDSEYPATPPRVLGTASTSSRGEGRKWVDIISDSVARVWTPGSVCLYDVIVDAGEKVDEIRDAEGQNPDGEGYQPGDTPAEPRSQQDDTAGRMGRINDDDDDDGGSTKATPNQSLHGALGLERPPDWILSEVVTEKKSVFVARAVSVQSKEQAEKYLDYLLAAEKKVAAATHNITAWRIQERKDGGPTAAAGGGTTTVQDFDDDGETAAGGRLLHLMQLMDVWNVLVVVSRWFGGVKLGPDRFRIINAAGRDALVKGGFDKSGTAADKQEKGKKKGKR